MRPKNGMRVGELQKKGLQCGDLDEQNTRWRIRRAVEKGRRGRWVSLPPDLFDAVLATLPPREDRAPDRPVFPGLTQERLRKAIARACKASATPTWSSARPPPPANQPLAPTRRNLGADRLTRRPAIALDHGGHVHACPARRPCDRPCGASGGARKPLRFVLQMRFELQT